VDIKKNIQKAATKRFMKFGLRSVSIEDICGDLRISKKTFYQYFPQKEALVESILNEFSVKGRKKMFEEVDVRCAGMNEIDRILFTASVNIRNHRLKFVNFFHDLVKYYPEIHKKHLLLNHQLFIENMSESISRGRQEGLFRTDFDEKMLMSFVSVHFLSMTNNVQAFSELDKESLHLFMVDLYLRVLCSRKGLDYYESKRASIEELAACPDGLSFNDSDIDSIVDAIIDLTEIVTNNKEE
jgi:AcrR family transcriptional regulator